MVEEPRNGDFESYIRAIEAQTLRRLQEAGLGTLDEETLTGMPPAKPARAKRDPFAGTAGNAAELSRADTREAARSVLSQLGWGSSSAQSTPQTQTTSPAPRRVRRINPRGSSTAGQFFGAALTVFGTVASLLMVATGADARDIFPMSFLMIPVGVFVALKSTK